MLTPYAKHYTAGNSVTTPPGTIRLPPKGDRMSLKALFNRKKTCKHRWEFPTTYHPNMTRTCQICRETQHWHEVHYGTWEPAPPGPTSTYDFTKQPQDAYVSDEHGTRKLAGETQ